MAFYEYSEVTPGIVASTIGATIPTIGSTIPTRALYLMLKKGDDVASIAADDAIGDFFTERYSDVSIDIDVWAPMPMKCEVKVYEGGCF